jgi:hypothetical protein
MPSQSLFRRSALFSVLAASLVLSFAAPASASTATAHPILATTTTYRQAPSAPGGISPDTTGCSQTQAGISFSGVGLYTVNYYFRQYCGPSPVIVTAGYVYLETSSGTIAQTGSPAPVTCTCNIFGAAGAYSYALPLSDWYVSYQFTMTTTDGSIWLPSNQCTGGSATTYCEYTLGPYQAP